MSKALENFLQMRDEWSALALEGKTEEAKEKMRAAQPLKKEFTKEDWLGLIASTNNQQAKYNYRQKMNEMYPEK